MRIPPPVASSVAPQRAADAGEPHFSPTSRIDWDAERRSVTLEGRWSHQPQGARFRVTYDEARNVVVGYPVAPDIRPDTVTPMPLEQLAGFVRELHRLTAN